MTQAQEYEIITEFVNGAGPVEYACFISDLWPVINKCRNVAIENPDTMIKPWLAIALELYKVPVDPKEFRYLYQAVLGFILFYKGLPAASNGS